MSERRYDLSKLSKTERTPQGGLRVPAYLTRTGVFNYQRSDGTVVRELRHPDEVFNPASLASLQGAPVTIGHPAKVTPENYAALSVGHVGDDVRGDGKFVAATLRVQTSGAVMQVERKDLVELSCGYELTIDPTPGVYEGEHYDAVQRDIRYNHVGLGPKNWGRAGNDVRLHVDGDEAPGLGPVDAEPCPEFEEQRADQVEIAPAYSDDMDPKELLARIAELEKNQEIAAARADGASADLKQQLATATAKADSLAAELATVDARVDARTELVSKARSFLGDKFVASGRSDREVMVACLEKHDSSFKADGKSDAYVEARFDFVSSAAKDANEKLASLNTGAEHADAGEDKADKAKRAYEASILNAWKGSN